MRHSCDNLKCSRGLVRCAAVRRAPRAALAGCLALLSGLWLPACEQRQSGAGGPPASRPTGAPDVVLTTPRDAAESVLRCLQAQRAARARHDRSAAEHYLEQLKAIAAHDTIMRRYETLIRRPAKKPDEILTRFVSGWGPIIGASADSLQFDRIQAPTPTTGVDAVHVLVPTAADSNARVRVECIRGIDGLWHVARIDWAFTRAAAPRPATRPAP